MQKKKKSNQKQQTRLKKEVTSKKLDSKSQDAKAASDIAAQPSNSVPSNGKCVSSSGQPIGRVVGLNNLGNTCYFNSLTQVGLIFFFCLFVDHQTGTVEEEETHIHPSHGRLLTVIFEFVFLMSLCGDSVVSAFLQI